MNCPICKNKMQEGGLLTDGVASGWVPLEEFNKKGVSKLVYTGLRTIGKADIFLRQTKIPNAFYCRKCNKVVGIFDVTNHLCD